jgi:hypothetical protein
MVPGDAYDDADHRAWNRQGAEIGTSMTRR